MSLFGGRRNIFCLSCVPTMTLACACDILCCFMFQVVYVVQVSFFVASAEFGEVEVSLLEEEIVLSEIWNGSCSAKSHIFP